MVTLELLCCPLSVKYLSLYFYFVYCDRVILVRHREQKTIQFSLQELQDSVKNRRLHVILCETLAKKNKFQHLSVLTITSENLLTSASTVINVCENTDWKANQFLTKPLMYRSFINNLTKTSPNISNDYILYTDSDTFWSYTNIDIIFQNYVIREKKILLYQQKNRVG